MPGATDVTVPEDGAYSFKLDRLRYGVDAGNSVAIAYTLEEPSTIELKTKDGWSATVNPSSNTQGEIVVTAPDPAVFSEIVAIATAADGHRTAVTLPVMIRDPYSDPTRTSVAAMGYYCFNTQTATDYHFSKMAECGMDMLTIESSDNWLEQLDLAHKYGMKGVLFVNGPAGDYFRDHSDTKLSDIIAIAKNHPALAGYQIFDEPHLMYLNQMKVEKARVEELDPNPEHPVYVNMGPSNASEETYGVKEFEDYVEILVSDLDLKFITFDQYPVYEGYIDPSWARTLDVFFKAAKRHNIPLWAFTLCCWEWYRETPTLENIRLQCNVNLAYGAQVNQFFVYRATSGTNFAPLMNDGTYKPVYYECKEYNRELHNREFIFAGSSVFKVRHIGHDYYLHGTHLDKSDLPEAIADITADGSVLVSFTGNAGNEYVLVCNKSWQEKRRVDIDFTREVYTIDREGVFSGHQPGRTSFTIDEGDFIAVKLR